MICFTDKKLLRVQKQSEGEITELVGFTDKKLLRVQKLVKKEAIKETVLLIRNY